MISPPTEVEFETSRLEGLFATAGELDGRLMHKLRLRSSCSSASDVAGSVGELSDGSCPKKYAISRVLGFWTF